MENMAFREQLNLMVAAELCGDKTPQLSVFSLYTMKYYRDWIRSAVYQNCDEMYYRFRLCQRWTDVATVVEILGPWPEHRRLYDFIQPLCQRCFAAVEWTQEHEAEVATLPAHLAEVRRRHQVRDALETVAARGPVKDSDFMAEWHKELARLSSRT